MRKFLLSLITLIPIACFGTTLSPIQLLNPVGSASGQAIVSNGASSAPAWKNVSATALTGILPVANGGTNCATASGVCLDNITGWSATGILTRTGAGTYSTVTTSAGLAAMLSDETGTGANVFGTAPTLNQPNIVGITSGASAAAGSVGEVLTATSTPTAITTIVTSAPVSKSLTPGIWDIQVIATITPAGTTQLGAAIAGVSASATNFTLGAGAFVQSAAVTSTAGAPMTLVSPTVRQAISSTTTYFGAVNVGFSTSTCTATVTINARRVN